MTCTRPDLIPLGRYNWYVARSHLTRVEADRSGGAGDRRARVHEPGIRHVLMFLVVEFGEIGNILRVLRR